MGLKKELTHNELEGGANLSKEDSVMAIEQLLFAKGAALAI